MDAETIAAGLTSAQRRALISADITPPRQLMPTYTSIKMPGCGMDGSEAEELRLLGLVTLPVRQGGYSGPSIYMGEIHPLGLAVRAIIEKEMKGES